MATHMMVRSRCSILVAAVALAVVAHAPAISAQERFPDPAPAHGLYSDAVRVGDLVFLSGVVSGHGDPRTQFGQVFARIGQILDEAGSGLEHIVDITTYHLDIQAHIGPFIEAKNEALPNLPTWTAVGVTELFSPGVLIEVKVIAAARPPSP